MTTLKMRLSFISIIGLVLLSFYTSFSQVNSCIESEINSVSYRTNYLNSLNVLRKDTNYLYNVIPTSGFQNAKILSLPHFPYPILFIHGIYSSADTWLPFFNYAISKGWSYGGQTNFCLNSDNDLVYSNITNAGTTDIKDYTASLTNADFYLLNFNVDADGTVYGGSHNTSTQSNQAAIKKQGIAVKAAIKHILETTGKNKVVIVSHSMGGLASREYLQNPVNWQDDGEHHIAKLVTLGTPHGGSNISGTSLSTFFTGIDEKSDAMRDLRKSYFYSGDPGVYLFGGVEIKSVMRDNIFGFYNYDVSCNAVDSELVIGLNHKSIPSNLDYCAVIGDWSLDPAGPGDGAVDVNQAQPKNYLPIVSETFVVPVNHTAIQSQTNTVFQAFDEPDDSNLAYEIKLSESYNGFLSLQAPDGKYLNDIDNYVFSIAASASIIASFSNFVLPKTHIKIINAQSHELMYHDSVSNFSFVTPKIWLPRGNYILEMSGNPTADSWQYPYNFKIDLTGKKSSLNLYPNPTAGSLQFSYCNLSESSANIAIYNQFGEKIKEENNVKLNMPILVEDLSNGIYFLSVTQNGTSIGNFKFVKVKK